MNASTTSRLLAFAKVLNEEEIDMGAEELLCFLTVAVRPGLSVGELAEETGLPQSTVSRHLKGLSAGMHRSKGKVGPLSWDLEVGREALLDQRVNPDNTRQKALHISRGGEALIDRFEKVLNGG